MYSSGSFFRSVYDWLTAPPTDPKCRPPHDPFNDEGTTEVVVPLALNSSVALASISTHSGRRRRERPIPLTEVFGDRTPGGRARQHQAALQSLLANNNDLATGSACEPTQPTPVEADQPPAHETTSLNDSPAQRGDVPVRLQNSTSSPV